MSLQPPTSIISVIILLINKYYVCGVRSWDVLWHFQAFPHFKINSIVQHNDIRGWGMWLGNTTGWCLLCHDNTHTHTYTHTHTHCWFSGHGALHWPSIVLLLPLLLTNSWSLAWVIAAGCAEWASFRPCQVFWHRGAWEIWASWTRSLKQSPVPLVLVLHMRQHLAPSGENDLVDTKDHKAEDHDVMKGRGMPAWDEVLILLLTLKLLWYSSNVMAFSN